MPHTEQNAAQTASNKKRRTGNKHTWRAKRLPTQKGEAAGGIRHHSTGTNQLDQATMQETAKSQHSFAQLQAVKLTNQPVLESRFQPQTNDAGRQQQSEEDESSELTINSDSEKKPAARTMEKGNGKGDSEASRTTEYDASDESVGSDTDDGNNNKKGNAGKEHDAGGSAVDAGHEDYNKHNQGNNHADDNRKTGKNKGHGRKKNSAALKKTKREKKRKAMLHKQRTGIRKEPPRK